MSVHMCVWCMCVWCVCACAYAFMYVFGVYVHECVSSYFRAYVNFVSNVKQLNTNYSKLVAAKTCCIIVTNTLVHLEEKMDH